MTRDLASEFARLQADAKADPDNLLLRKRRDLCAAAMRGDKRARETYLDEYGPPKTYTEVIDGYRPSTAPRNPKPPQGGSALAPARRKPDLSSKRRPEKVPADEDFVRAWQASRTAKEAAATLGIPAHHGWVAGKAAAMRRHGVKMKEMPKSRKDLMDVDALNALIEQLERRPKAVGS